MKLFHRHKWKVAGVHPLYQVTDNPAFKGIQQPITEVLLVCGDCGTPRTLCLDGHWTLEQMHPQPNDPEADLDFFRKLGARP